MTQNKNTKKTSNETKKQADQSYEKNCKKTLLEKENLIKKLQEENSQLQKKIQELQEMTKRAQADYVNMKMDFDILQRKIQEKEKNMSLEILLETVKKFLPNLEELRIAIENSQNNEDPFVKGVSLIYQKFLKTLESLNIYQLSGEGENPNSNYHVPISTQEVQDKKLKGKVIKELQKAYIYKKGDTEKVVQTAKVIIGQ